MDPAILELAGSIIGQGSQRPILIGRHDQTRFEQCLEAVANAEDELIRVSKAPQALAEKVRELVGEDFSCCHIIAVSKATRHDQNLVAVQQARLFAQAINMDALGQGTGPLEGELGLSVTI